MQLAGRRAAWNGLLIAVVCCGCSSLGRRGPALADEGAGSQPGAGGPAVQPASFAEAALDAEPLSLRSFSPDNLGQTFKQMTGRGPDPELARQHFAQGEGHYRQAVTLRGHAPEDSRAEFLAAADAFAMAADRWPGSTLEHEALFLLGECCFFTDRYPQAEDAFERLLKQHPHSKHMDRIQPLRFAIAQFWLEDANQQAFYEVNLTDATRPSRDTFGHAVRVLDRIRLDDPTGKLADDATLTLGNAFFRRGKFLRADEYYTDLRKTFPSSEHQFIAHFLGLKAKLLSYQGPDYSANALVEADKLLTQIRRQFPLDAQQHGETLARAQAEVRYRQAEREWVLAEHYDRRSEFGAARFHYQTLLDTYPGTPLAERAAERMREIGGLADNPPQRLSWLVELFPEKDFIQPLIATGSATTQRR